MSTDKQRTILIEGHVRVEVEENRPNDQVSFSVYIFAILHFRIPLFER